MFEGGECKSESIEGTVVSTVAGRMIGSYSG